MAVLLDDGGGVAFCLRVVRLLQAVINPFTLGVQSRFGDKLLEI